METTAVLTTNTFKLTGNLKPLDKDIVQPYNIIVKSPKLNRCLLNWLILKNQQCKYFKLQFNLISINLENKHNEQHNQFKNFTNAKLTKLDSDIVNLDQAIEQEKLDRIRTEKENIENIKESIDFIYISKILLELFRNLELEKQTKVANEKKILNTIKDTSQSINQAIKNEAIEKEQKHQELIKILIIHYNLRIDIQKNLETIQLKNFIYK